MSKDNGMRLGWIGAGRMGFALASRLLAAGHDVAVWNRTRAKAEPLADLGATIVDAPADLADRDIVFTMVGGDATISPGASQVVRDAAEQRGTAVLAAPVSGNPKVVAAGRLTIVASGPREAFDLAAPYLDLFGAGVTYVGEGDRARLVKICHNLMLGIVAQTLAEIAVLAEKGGVSRADLMAFLNDSVMGSMFTRYKTPAYVNLDFTPTFTPALLLKDFQLGLEAARDHEVPMPVAAAAEQVVQSLVGNGYDDVDFAALLEYEAKASGLDLEPEDADVSDGLAEASTNGDRPAARTAA